MFSIIKVDTKKTFKKFIDFPHELYKKDPNYVPELYISKKAMLNKEKSPFFLHSKADFFAAVNEQGDIVGTIAAIRNNNYIKFTGEKCGFFGFFDVINDFNVAKALLDKACTWVKDEGLDFIIGPENYSTNETCGMLIEGYDSPPTIMMTYNFPYYNDFMEKYGLKKKMDLFAWNLIAGNIPERVIDLADKVEKRLFKNGITFRRIDLNNSKNEIKIIKELYNKVWDKNWGFTPVTDIEFDHIAKDLMQIIDPDFVIIAEKENKAIGFSLSILNYNQIFKNIKKGRLFPFGLLKLLINKKKIDTIRILLMGVLNEYRKIGIDACFYAQTIKMAQTKKIKQGEASWILENNKEMNAALEKMNGTISKKYRLYIKEV